jgi:hypothetical protein
MDDNTYAALLFSIVGIIYIGTASLVAILIISGVTLILSAIGVFVFRGSLGPNHGAAILLGVLVVSVFGMIFESLRAQRQL